LLALTVLVRGAAAIGTAVSGALIVSGVVRVVGVGDTVAVRVGVLTVVRVVRERISTVWPAVAIGVRAIRVGPARVLLGIGQTIAIGIRVGVSTRVRVEAVGHFPSIWQAVTIGVRFGHISSLLLFLSIC
jgi:hypothetical protein